MWSAHTDEVTANQTTELRGARGMTEKVLKIQSLSVRPVVSDHFKTGQVSRARDLQLF